MFEKLPLIVQRWRYWSRVSKKIVSIHNSLSYNVYNTQFIHSIYFTFLSTQRTSTTQEESNKRHYKKYTKMCVFCFSRSIYFKKKMANFVCCTFCIALMVYFLFSRNQVCFKFITDFLVI